MYNGFLRFTSGATPADLLTARAKRGSLARDPCMVKSNALWIMVTRPPSPGQNDGQTSLKTLRRHYLPATLSISCYESLDRFLILKVVAVAARKLEGSQAFAQKFGIPRSYGSYEELARDENVGKQETLRIKVIWSVPSHRTKAGAGRKFSWMLVVYSSVIFTRSLIFALLLKLSLSVNRPQLGELDLLPPATKLGQGNVFTGVCDSVNRGASSGGYLLPGGVCYWGVSPPEGGICFWDGGVCSWGRGWRHPRDGYYCGRYASYWNAFLFYRKFRVILYKNYDYNTLHMIGIHLHS